MSYLDRYSGVCWEGDRSTVPGGLGRGMSGMDGRDRTYVYHVSFFTRTTHASARQLSFGVNLLNFPLPAWITRFVLPGLAFLLQELVDFLLWRDVGIGWRCQRRYRWVAYQ